MIRKRGQFYSYEFMQSRRRFYGVFNGADGSPLPQSKREARERESAIRAQIRAGTYIHTADRKRFSVFFDEVFLPYSKAHKQSWRHDEFRGEVLKEHFGNKTFEQITPMLVVGFVNARLSSTTKRHATRGATTVHKETSLLGAIFRMAITEGLAVSNPVAALPKTVKKRIPARRKRERFLTLAEEDRLFAALTGRRSHLWPIVMLALETGLRCGELRRLEVSHVNLGDTVREIVVDGVRVRVQPGELICTRGKNGKPRTIPMSDRARAVAVAQVNDVTTGRYLFTSRRTRGMIAEIKTGFCRAVVDADIQDFCFHDLRHSFATRLAEAGVDAFAIRDLLGHSTTSMSNDYTHTSPSHRREAIEMVGQRRITSGADSGRIPSRRVNERDRLTG